MHNESILSELKESRESLEDGVNKARGELKNLEYDISDVVKPPRSDNDASRDKDNP